MVILNFLEEGDRRSEKDMSACGSAMFGPMAETGNGSVHFGRAVTVEGAASFDTVVVVYYRGGATWQR